MQLKWYNWCFVVLVGVVTAYVGLNYGHVNLVNGEALDKALPIVQWLQEI